MSVFAENQKGDSFLFDDARRWNGGLEAVFAPSADRTVLRKLNFYGPLRIQSLFYPECAEGTRCAHCYLLHPPGGLVSGDHLNIDVKAIDGARALITTPAMTKVYMTDSHHVSQSESISLKAESSDLEWLPQGVIFFDGSDAIFSLKADLDEQSSLIALSLNVFGRKPNGADYIHARCRIDSYITRNGIPLLSEQLELEPGSDLLKSPYGLSGFGVCGQLYAIVRPEDEAALEQECSKMAPEFARYDDRAMVAVTFANHVAAVRVLGESSEEVFSLLISAWERLRPVANGRSPLRPRIWNT